MTEFFDCIWAERLQKKVRGSEFLASWFVSEREFELGIGSSAEMIVLLCAFYHFDGCTLCILLGSQLQRKVNMREYGVHWCVDRQNG